MNFRVLLISSLVILILVFVLLSSYLASNTMNSKLYKADSFGKNTSSLSHSKSFSNQSDLILNNKTATKHNINMTWIPSHISISYIWTNNGLKVNIIIKRPNPCYTITLVGYRVYKKILIIELKAKAPPPGTYCIQVIPPPFKSTVFFTVEKGDYTLLIIINGKPVKRIPVTP